MDRVLLLESGRVLYQGPAHYAPQYFEDLGFQYPQEATTAEFLTSVCDFEHHQIESGTPTSVEELERGFRQSSLFHDIERITISARNRPPTKNKTPSFLCQIKTCINREFWILWGDRAGLYTKVFVLVSAALVVASLFHGEKLDTSGAFSRGGALFFSILYVSWLQMAELIQALMGREIIQRQVRYGLYRPSALVLARAIVDMVVVLFMTVLFSAVFYNLTGLNRSGNKFGLYFLFLYTTTLSITAFYRMLAAVCNSMDNAVRFAGLAMNVLTVFVGYVIPKKDLTGQGSVWFGWLLFLNPLSYGYEALMSIEFWDREMKCAPSMLVPRKPGSNSQSQGCSLTGSRVGETVVAGQQYLWESFQFTRNNLWRNWGIIVALTAAYLVITALATELLVFGDRESSVVFARKSNRRDLDQADEENVTVEEPRRPKDEKHVSNLAQRDHVLTWANLSYSTVSGQRLLDDVSGYVKSGSMMALMGVSGAGKTTLLHTLAQRQQVGSVQGEILVDGRPLGPSFARSIGYCEQTNLYEETATVREALEFSALLRQGSVIPDADKIAHAHEVLEDLELSGIQHAVIRSLSLEQKKRVTIGLELAARPSIVLFLDEPTSGLDSHAAFSIVQLLRRLARGGLAIICTIHQPSFLLIQQFDELLAMGPGGRTIYFGHLGPGCRDVIDYLAGCGVACPPKDNPVDILLTSAAEPLEWSEQWRSSPLGQRALQVFDRVRLERSQHGCPDEDPREFTTSTWKQIMLLMRRTLTQHWRDPPYYYSKLFVSVVGGILNGFTFWQLDNSVQSLQNRIFSLFLIILLPPIFMNGVLPRFCRNRELWLLREYPRRMYSWGAFCTSNIAGEIPAAVLCAVIYYVLWYFPVGFSTSTSDAGYMCLMTILFFLFQSSWGQWIGALSLSPTILANTLPFFFLTISLFNGIVRPFSDMPSFWSSWMYYLSPVTWWLRGAMAALFPSVAVQCTPNEATYFQPDVPATCAQHLDIVGHPPLGVLVNPLASQYCQYCPYANGTEYSRSLNVQDGDKWRACGILVAFVIANWLLVYLLGYVSWTLQGWWRGLNRRIPRPQHRFLSTKPDSDK